jgi:hypothetical protein
MQKRHSRALPLVTSALREKQWRSGAQYPDSHPLPGSGWGNKWGNKPHRVQPIPADLDLAKTA